MRLPDRHRGQDEHHHRRDCEASRHAPRGSSRTRTACASAETKRVEAACNIAEAGHANVTLCAAAAPGDPTGSGGAAGRKPDA